MTNNKTIQDMTIRELRALLEGGAPAKTVEPKVAKSKKASKKASEKAAPAKEAKKASAFYTDVIVAKREEREIRAKVNREAASWMREKGLTPQGQAWAAVKNGERSVVKLRSLNKADGYEVVAAEPKAAKAKVAKAAEVEAVIEVAVEKPKRARRSRATVSVEPEVVLTAIVEPEVKPKRTRAKAKVETQAVETKPAEAVAPLAEELEAVVAELVTGGFTEAEARTVAGV